MVEKRVIIDVLKKSIHDLLVSNELIDLVGLEDSTHTHNLCSAIEALFIHGQIRNQLFNPFSKFSRNKQSYEYDFWNFIQNFIPKNLLHVLENNDLKLTNIGLSRVWLRYALNECTILSYIDSMRSDFKKLQHYYIKDALIRDDEMMETFRGLLTSIERIPFNLNTNCSLLNTWINSDALKIAGVNVIVPAQCENSDKCNLLETGSTNTYDFRSLSNVSIDDDQIVTSVLLPTQRCSSSVPSKENMIMTKNIFSDSVINVCHENTFNSNEPEENISTDNQNLNENNYIEFSNNSNINDDFNYEENLIQDVQESESLTNNENLNETNLTKPFNEFCKNAELEIVKDTIHTSNDVILDNNYLLKTKFCDSKIVESYDQLWSQHNLISQKSIESIKTTDSDEFLIQNNSENNQNDYISSGSVQSQQSKESSQSWELVGDELVAKTLEMKRLMEIFPGVKLCSTNNGLNSVFGGLCSKCKKPLESGRALIDHYDGNLFCIICENGSKSVIPRNVIYNWDFEQKFVSETTKRFLSEMMSHPIINLAEHPNLFEVIPELSRVQLLRRKLNLLWLQVTSCDIQTSTKVRETMFPREYMLTNVNESDLYSLEDLIILQSGVLEKTLLFVINKIAIPHVKKCLMCRMKAMPCDKCLDEKRVIYIHEIDEYFECSAPLCKSVIHKTCKNKSTISFYCRRCIQYLEHQQPITLASYDTANYD